MWEYLVIFCGILSVPYNIVMNPNNGMYFLRTEVDRSVANETMDMFCCQDTF